MPKGCKILFPPIKKILNLGDITQEGEGKAEYLIIVKERLVLKFTPYLPYESFFSSEADLLNFIMGIFREGGGGHVYPPPDLINQGHMLHGSTCLLFLLLCSQGNSKKKVRREQPRKEANKFWQKLLREITLLG